MASSEPSLDQSYQNIQVAFQSNYDSLVQSLIEPDSLARVLYSESYIDKETRDKVLEPSIGNTTQRKNNTLIDAVETFLKTIQNETDKISYLLSILEQKKHLHGTIDKIRLQARFISGNVVDSESPRSRPKLIDLPVEERMSREFTQLKVCFASMLKKIKKSLSENIELDNLKEHLSLMHTREEIDYDILQNSSNTDEVFDKIIRPECDVSNYDMLCGLASGLNEDSIKLAIARYEKEQDEFDVKLLDEDFAIVIDNEMRRHKSSSSSLPKTEIRLKVEWARNDATLKQFRGLIRRIFPGLYMYIHLTEVKNGCVLFSCYSHGHIENELVKVAREELKTAKELKVVYLEIGTHVIIDDRKVPEKSEASILGIATTTTKETTIEEEVRHDHRIWSKPGDQYAPELPEIVSPVLSLTPQQALQSFKTIGFPVDGIITMLGMVLLVLSLLAEHFAANGTVACDLPANISAHLATLISSACSQSLFHWSYYPFLLFSQGLALILAQYLWHYFSKWHLQVFIDLVEKLRGQPLTAAHNCGPETTEVIAKLEESFSRSKKLIHMYGIRIVCLVVLWSLCAAPIIALLRFRDPYFKCSKPRWENNFADLHKMPLQCIHRNYQCISSIWAGNLLILLIVLLAISYDVFWFFMGCRNITTLQEVTQFCEDSHLLPHHFVPSSCTSYQHFQNDLEFLTYSLSYIDSSLHTALKYARIYNGLKQLKRMHANQFVHMRYLEQNEYLKDREGSDKDILKRFFDYGFTDIDSELCRLFGGLLGGLNYKHLPSIQILILQCLRYVVSPDNNDCVVDVTFGTPNFGQALGRAFKQALSISFYPHFKGSSKLERCLSHSLLQLPEEIYANNVFKINEVDETMFDLIFENIDDDERGDAEKRMVIDFLVFGPMLKKDHSITANVLVSKLYNASALKRNCSILSLRPMKIGTEDVSIFFHEFVPMQSMFTLEKGKLDDALKEQMKLIRESLQEEEDTSSTGEVSDSTIVIQCGPLSCTFELKVYRFKDYYFGHELYRFPSLEYDDVFEPNNEFLN